MLNQLILVGKVQDLKKRTKKTIITLKVPRNYKNINGEYENDIIVVETFGDIAKKAIEYIQNGDLVGVKGRLAKLENSKEKLHIIANKVTSLSNRKEDDGE